MPHARFHAITRDGILGMNYVGADLSRQHIAAQSASGKSQDSFLNKYASTAAICGAKHGIGEALDRHFGLYADNAGSELDKEMMEIFGDELKFENSKPLDYKNIFKVDNEHLKWKDLNWKNYKAQVSKNTKWCRNTLASPDIKDFFGAVSAKDYAKQTLWEGNVKPIRQLLAGSSKNVFRNLFYASGVAFMGAGIFSTGLKHYRYWKKQENGSISGHWKTAYQTAKAVLEKSTQSFGSWEAAGVGMAIGQALIPIGAFPLGGILVAALFSTAAYKAIGKLFPRLSRPGPLRN